MPDFLGKVSESLGINNEDSGGQLSFRSIIGKQGPQFPNEIVQYAGGFQETDAEMKDVESFGNFTFQAFPSKEALEAYLASPDYNTPSKPGMCFGF